MDESNGMEELKEAEDVLGYVNNHLDGVDDE